MSKAEIIEAKNIKTWHRLQGKKTTGYFVDASGIYLLFEGKLCFGPLRGDEWVMNDRR